MKVAQDFAKSVYVLQLLVFLGISTLKVNSQDVIENLNQNGDGISSPHCTLEYCKSYQEKDQDIKNIPLYILSLIETVNSTECVSIGNTNEGNFSKSVQCSEKIITVSLERGIDLPRIRINCTDTLPLDFNSSLELPLLGMDVVFSNTIPTRGQLLHKISATFPVILNVYHGGLPEYSGYYAFTRKDPPFNLTFKIDIAYAGESRKSGLETTTGVHRGLCLDVFKDRAICSADYAGNEMYLVNIGGKNPWTTSFLQPCLDSKKVCSNKIHGRVCLRGRSCKTITPIYQNGLIRCSVNNYTEDVEYFRDIYGELHQNEDIFNWKHISSILMIQDEDKQTRMEIKNPEEPIEYEEVPDSEDDDTNITTYEENHTNDNCLKTRAIVIPDQPKLLQLYDQEMKSFECHYLDYFLVTPAVWYIGWTNGSKTELLQDYGDKTTDEERYVVYETYLGKTEGAIIKVKSSHFIIQASLGMRNISCELWYWNSSGKAVSVQTVNIIETKPPKFNESKVYRQVNKETILQCQETVSIPPASYIWEFEDKALRGGAIIFDQEHNRHISTISIGVQSGTYTCIARNFLGESRKAFVMTVDAVGVPWLIIVTVGLCILGLIGVAMALLYRKFSAQMVRLSYLEFWKEFVSGNKDAVVPEEYAHVNAKNMPYNITYEYSWSAFNFDEKDLLGSGAYGVVYKGSIEDGQAVAVKTLRAGVDKQILNALLDELKIMIYLGQHENIVDLKGACTQFLTEGRAYVLVEWCEFGSLESFIRKNERGFRPYVNEGYVNTTDANDAAVVEFKEFTKLDLLIWSIQIATGMQYLEEKKVIHGDLAIRNVLMKSMNNVKITDFGLSRQLVNTDIYVKTQQCPLPWRYMAIEAMRRAHFTSKSDVWSYGVTVWEIFTLGAIPYPGIAWTPEFMQLLEDNMRLYQPKHANNHIYKILLRCWHSDPESRPCFQELANAFSKLEPQFINN